MIYLLINCDNYNLFSFLASIVALITFLAMIFSKLLQYLFLDMDHKTVVRMAKETEEYTYEYHLDKGNEAIFIYNNYENIFNIKFYKWVLDGCTYKNKEEYKVPGISKLVAGEKILIRTIIPDIMPTLEICWEDAAKNKFSALVFYNGRDGFSLSTIKYKKTFFGFFYYFFR